MHSQTMILLVTQLVLSGATFRDDMHQQSLAPPKDNFTLTPIRDALVSNKVIGDVLNDFEPEFYLDITYPDTHKRVYLGNELSIEDVASRPAIAIYNIPERRRQQRSNLATFTVILTDPDATSRYDPKWSEMCHWILTNLTAPSLEGGLLEGGVELKVEDSLSNSDSNLDNDHAVSKHKKKQKHRRSKQCKKDKKGGKCLPGELESYFPPGPPPRTGWHRYVFVLLEGDAMQLKRPLERKHWGYGYPRHGVRDWAMENGLEVVSANFFFTENEKQ